MRHWLRDGPLLLLLLLWDAGSVSASTLPMGVECPARPGDSRRVRVAWEKTPSGVRSLVISPSGHMLISPEWRAAPPIFTCRASFIDVTLQPSRTIPLTIEDGGERVVPDPAPLRALLESLWKESPGSVASRAEEAQGLLSLYSALLGKDAPSLRQEVSDLLLREQLWTGGDDRPSERDMLWRRFSSTPRGRKLLDEYLEHRRKKAGVPFQLRFEKELGIAYSTDVSGAHPLMFWQGAFFCVAQVGKDGCSAEGPCKGRDVIRCYDTSTRKWGPKHARGATPSQAPGTPPEAHLRGELYTLVSQCGVVLEGAQRSVALEALLRPQPEWGGEPLACSLENSEGKNPERLLSSADEHFAVLVVLDRKLLGYDCPPGRISCGGFEEWDDKYRLLLYSVVFDP